MAIASGTVIANKFEIVSQIGEGGMGEVFRARQTSMWREVAIKLLKEAGVMDENAYKRFQREAKILAALRHPNLVQCYEFGQWNGIAYIAMELVKGKGLQSELYDNVGLEPQRVIRIALQTAAALDCAHASGVFHRDLKPHNIMICPPSHEREEEHIKLIDFGLAKLLPNDGKTITKLTGTGMAVGSLSYMPPEQCMGKTVDARSDIYALGAVLHHALSGRLPFDADNPVAMMYKHLQDEPLPLRRDDLPAGLENLILTCLMKEPDDRYQSMGELTAALHMVAEGRGHVIKRPIFALLEKQVERQKSSAEPSHGAIAKNLANSISSAIAPITIKIEAFASSLGNSIKAVLSGIQPGLWMQWCANPANWIRLVIGIEVIVIIGLLFFLSALLYKTFYVESNTSHYVEFRHDGANDTT